MDQGLSSLSLGTRAADVDPDWMGAQGRQLGTPPTNDDFGGAMQVAVGSSGTASTLDATLETGEPSAGTGVTSTVWFWFLAGPSTYSVTVSRSTTKV